MPRPRSPLKAAAVGISLALLAGSCASPFQFGGDDDPGSGSQLLEAEDTGIPEVNFATPLPAGARVLPPGELRTTEAVECAPHQSLEPVDEPPGDLVPLIEQRGRLIVGIDQGSNLFSFRDPTSGDLTGFDVDLAREIARDIFDDPTAVEFRSLTSEDRIAALESREVDVVIGSTPVTCERRERIRFSVPYYQAYQRALTVRGSDINEFSDLDGQRLCVAGDVTSAQALTEEVSNVTVLSVNTWADCLVAIQQNQVDAVTTDDAILVGITEQDPYLEIVGPHLETEPYGVAIGQSTPGFDTDGLVRQVNSTLERIRDDGTWSSMYDEWLSLLGSTSGMPPASYVPEEAGDD